MLGQPVVELVDDGPALLLAYAQPFIGIYVFPLSLEFVELPNEQQRLFGQLALAGRMQFEELAPRMGPAARLGVTLPLFRVVLSPTITRPFYAVPRTSVARTASG